MVALNLNCHQVRLQIQRRRSILAADSLGFETEFQTPLPSLAQLAAASDESPKASDVAQEVKRDTSAYVDSDDLPQEETYSAGDCIVYSLRNFALHSTACRL